MCIADEATSLPLHPSMCSPKLKTSLAFEQRPGQIISGLAHPSVPMFEAGKEVLDKDIVRAKPTSATLAVMLPASSTFWDLMSRWRILACKAAAALGATTFSLAVGRSCLLELCSSSRSNLQRNVWGALSGQRGLQLLVGLEVVAASRRQLPKEPCRWREPGPSCRVLGRMAGSDL